MWSERKVKAFESLSYKNGSCSESTVKFYTLTVENGISILQPVFKFVSVLGFALVAK